MPFVMIFDLSPPYHAPKNKRKFHEATAPGSAWENWQCVRNVRQTVVTRLTLLLGLKLGNTDRTAAFCGMWSCFGAPYMFCTALTCLQNERQGLESNVNHFTWSCNFCVSVLVCAHECACHPRKWSVEMKYLRTVKGCSRLDHIENEDIRKELNVQSVQNKVEKHKQKPFGYNDRWKNTETDSTV
jgi:hypothetical protein